MSPDLSDTLFKSDKRPGSAPAIAPKLQTDEKVPGSCVQQAVGMMIQKAESGIDEFGCAIPFHHRSRNLSSRSHTRGDLLDEAYDLWVPV